MQILDTIGGRIMAFLVLFLIIGGLIYFQFMNDKKENEQLNDSTQTISADIIVLQTNLGEIKIELFGDQAPKTVENFKKLAQTGFYDGVKFHRVIKGFMIQSGDPLTKDDSQKAMWGTGGPGYSFEDEIYESNSNGTDTIAMANSGPNTNGSQFFINTADNNFLDSKHTVFGKVIAGMEAVRQIENVETDGNDIPLTAVVIESAILQ